MTHRISVLRALVFLATPCLTWGQDAPTPKRPAIEAGFEERVRYEEWNNIIDHDNLKADARTHYRFLSRAWATIQLDSNLEIGVGLCGENRKTTKPSSYVYNGREVIFETLYADWRFSPTMSVKVGRQNIKRGEGFVLMDGSSGDGSRSTYFNAAILCMKWNTSTLEILGITDPKDDRYLPVINRISNPAEKIRLNEWDEEGLGVYYTYKGWAPATLETYAILKSETNDYRPIANPLFRPDRRFTTVGVRKSGEWGKGWSTAAELAGQWGTQDHLPGTTDPSKNIEAWGGYFRLKKSFESSWKPKFSLGYIALSGQNPRSSKITAWDPVFSRWPKWSELYVYSLIPENGVAYWANTIMWEAEARVTPCKGFDLRGTFYRMNAQHAQTTPSPILSTGKCRGDLWEVRADFVLSDSWKGNAVYERLAPGNIYIARDSGQYFRLEFTWTFRTRRQEW